jgi:hypothetical protein
MMPTPSTVARPSSTSSFGDGSFLTTLKRSSTSAEDATISWLEIVLMIAASTAASTRPAMNG